MEVGRTIVRGGFFWLRESAAIEIEDGAQALIAHCVFVSKPRWWEIRRWYQAWRLWLNMTDAARSEAEPWR